MHAASLSRCLCLGGPLLLCVGRRGAEGYLPSNLPYMLRPEYIVVSPWAQLANLVEACAAPSSRRRLPPTPLPGLTSARPDLNKPTALAAVHA